MKRITCNLGSLLALALIMGLSACGGSGSFNSNHPGELPEPKTLTARAEIVGASVSPYRVRAGSPVVLTGQNSHPQNDPILKYEWAQVDQTGYKVDFYERTTNTVAFTAPAIPFRVTEGVNLVFKLTVTDAKGATSSANVEVPVYPSNDGNHFLTTPAVDNTVRVFINGEVGDVIANSIPVTLALNATATWQGRDGKTYSLPINEAKQVFSGDVLPGVVTAVNGDQAFAAKVNLPTINIDEINKHFTGANRAGRLELERVSNAQITLAFSIAQTGGSALSVYLADNGGSRLVDINSLSSRGGASSGLQRKKPIISGGETSAEVNVEQLRQAIGLDSALSASNYYRCLDPAGETLSFEGWRKRAGFADANNGDVHTRYINNYDLGFGRDMHVRKDANGNVFSYVINYPTLANTIDQRNEFAIVAMEYSPAPTGNCGDKPMSVTDTSKKIVKFFAYVPDVQTGGYVRSNSMNFDGRGEKYLPGVCTACHFGNERTADFNTTGAIAAASADLGAGFMPWDLDSLLYSSAEDPKLVDQTYKAFAKASGLSAEQIAVAGLEQQAAAFKQQNQMVLDTYTQDASNIPRYTQAIKLLHGWYGDAAHGAAVDALNFGTPDQPLTSDALAAIQQQVKTLPSGTFNGRYIPSAWNGDARQAELYTGVFERNCRLCHQLVNNPAKDFDNYAEFVNHPQLRSYVFERGIMPMSRLTMDRFWVDYGVGSGLGSPAVQLRNHLNTDASASNNIPRDLQPGMPVAIVSPAANVGQSADIFLDFDEAVTLDASASLFATAYQWQRNGAAVATSSTYRFSASTPNALDQIALYVTSPEGASESAIRRIKTNAHTPVIENLPALSVTEGSSVNLNLFTSLCPTAAVDAKACRAVFGDIKAGEKPLITLSGVTRGTAVVTNATTGVIRFTSTAAKAAGDGSFTITITDSFGKVSAPVTVTVAVNDLAAPTVVSDTCNVNAFHPGDTFTTCPDVLANDSAANGLTLSLLDVDTSSTRGGTVTQVGNTIRYTPPTFFVGTDSFKYRVVDSSPSSKQVEGSVTVNVSALQTYSALKQTILAECSSCHVPNASPPPDWTNYSAIRSIALGATLLSKITTGSVTSQAEMLHIRLFQHACDSGGHSGSNKLCNTSQAGASPTNPNQLNALGTEFLRWIEEGARNN